MVVFKITEQQALSQQLSVFMPRHRKKDDRVWDSIRGFTHREKLLWSGYMLGATIEQLEEGSNWCYNTVQKVISRLKQQGAFDKRFEKRR